MATHSPAAPRISMGSPINAMLVAGSLGLALVSVALIYLLGLYALLVPAYLGAIWLILVNPRAGALLIMSVAIVLEPGVDDWTKPIADCYWELPSKWTFTVVTVSPFELLLVLCAGSIAFRSRGMVRAKLPILTWAVLLALAAGLAYGKLKGAPSNLAYHEMRGFIFGAVVFFIAMRMPGSVKRPAIAIILGSAAVAALICINRYWTELRTGRVQSEVAFAHETPVFLAIGMMLALALLPAQKETWKRLVLLMFAALFGIAIIATSRRAGTLVVLTGLLTLGALLFRHRPVLITCLGAAALIAGTAYVGAYWNHEYGALAQPARAIRSQIDPSTRDQSSDMYRETEKYNVAQTLRLNRLFGVGFGRPFIQFQPLPDLTSFWPLQHYVPHENVLWLWLKLGLAGTAVVLGFTVIALRRLLNAASQLKPEDPRWVLAAICACVVLMYLAYSTVDIAFGTSRSVAPLAAAIAIGVTQPFERKEAPA
ncbi:MAG: O-antigen ligase family protein [Hyphomicrobiales bacterium]